MKCPIDGETLVMTDRQGIEIDYCPKCRGVWLDRGELDKIIERVAPAPRAEAVPSPAASEPAAAPGGMFGGPGYPSAGGPPQSGGYPQPGGYPPTGGYPSAGQGYGRPYRHDDDDDDDDDRRRWDPRHGGGPQGGYGGPQGSHGHPQQRRRSLLGDLFDFD